DAARARPRAGSDGGHRGGPQAPRRRTRPADLRTDTSGEPPPRLSGGSRTGPGGPDPQPDGSQSPRRRSPADQAPQRDARRARTDGVGPRPNTDRRGPGVGVPDSVASPCERLQSAHDPRRGRDNRRETDRRDRRSETIAVLAGLRGLDAHRTDPGLVGPDEPPSPQPRPAPAAH